MNPRSLLLLVFATLAAGAPTLASPAGAVLDASKMGAPISLVGAEPRGTRPAGVNFVQRPTDRGRIQLTGGATATATISVVLETNVGAVRPPVSLGELEKGVKEIPFWFKTEKSGPAVSLMFADNKVRVSVGTATNCE